MQTTVHKINEVEYELEIKATAEDLSADMDKAVRAQRGSTTMKGFRPGRVPLSLVKKVHGKSLAYGVAENTVQKTYETEVLKAEKYQVLGQPTITDLDYEYEGDLRAVVRFGVRPEIELKDLSSETIYRLQNEVTDGDIDKEIETMRAGRAELLPEDEPATEESVVTVDMQKLDPASQTPIVGDRQKGLSILLSDENVLPQLKDGLLGKKAGDTFTASFPGPEENPEPRSYQVSVVAVNRRELPDLDDDLVSQLTGEELTSVDAFREQIQKQLTEGWERRSKEMFETELISRTMELHDFQIPESVIDMYLDAYVNEVRQQGGGELPPDFDEAQYRELRRDEARDQAGWMFVRDKIIADQFLAVSEDDRDAFLEKTTGEGMDLDTIKEYYRAVPNMLEQLDQRLLSDKVFAWIGDQMTIVEKDLESYRELTEKQES